jgi:threonine dehydratase
MITSHWIIEAQKRIEPYIRRTPLTYDARLNIYLKWENHQTTGSFKARGALNRVLSLQPQERANGIVTASAGNHGQGVALAARLLGISVLVFAADQASPTKLQAMRDLGAELCLVPGGYGEAERAGRQYATDSRATWISPYNDPWVIAGQGTIALETQQDLPYLPEATWLVPVGGGGLIAGIGLALKENAFTTRTKVIGIQSQASPFMYDLYHHGSQEHTIEKPSLADGLSGPVEKDSLTIPLVKRYVDDLLLVSEEEIAEAVRYAWEKYAERIEGSAAVSLAAILTGKITSRPAVLIISGGNIQPELHRQIVEGKLWKT